MNRSNSVILDGAKVNYTENKRNISIQKCMLPIRRMQGTIDMN